MIKIGLIGEDPNDTDAIINLMKQKFDKGYQYIKIAKRITGDQLYNPGSVNIYNTEVGRKRPDHVIVMIDADAVITQKEKLAEKTELYYKIAKQLKCKSILLLNIYELEALILADIDGVNKTYGTKSNYSSNVMHQEDAKEELKKITRKGRKVYHPNDCPELFKKLSFDTVHNNCVYFKEFVQNFRNITNS